MREFVTSQQHKARHVSSPLCTNFGTWRYFNIEESPASLNYSRLKSGYCSLPPSSCFESYWVSSRHRELSISTPTCCATTRIAILTTETPALHAACELCMARNLLACVEVMDREYVLRRKQDKKLV
ncbi:hypothetical protein Mp_6g01820 [Marchantia polymorpha subsp. ruderalis]|uniref:Uncharacterized protein n=2 Tax=Marchantia polymorpha TaxID=3197 RepID=A0AAF6BMJ2_MARPO|nr:hypothetical protein MARPO_0052s0022 [Marchantia polymorpha]BBN13226.1 hypothetical protein Mp_6g01820 [Marchantia polymorpha subsp. ruderalis]|eukprot:PTQ38219.1 hypothetical protein MARPO_0052s0022 [Marchantia polymorpha]